MGNAMENDVVDVMEDDFKALDAMDRDALMLKMAEELPKLREALDVSMEALAEKAGVDEERLGQAESGSSILKWSEYMSILFVFWNNDIGRGIVESKGLFPDALKRAMSVNRNAHAPNRRIV